MGKIYYKILIVGVEKPIEISDNDLLIKYVKELIDKGYYPYYTDTDIAYGKNDISLEIRIYFEKWG